jgi:hypothetical protein
MVKNVSRTNVKYIQELVVRASEIPIHSFPDKGYLFDKLYKNSILKIIWNKTTP